jgi:hypothetical protein
MSFAVNLIASYNRSVIEGNAMTKKRAQLFSVAGMLLLVLSLAGFARLTSAAEETAKANVFAGDTALKDLANYRQWTRVNEKALPVLQESSRGRS